MTTEQQPSDSRWDQETIKMLDAEQHATGRSLVAFVTNQGKDSLMGSGTLARLGDRWGVLTCSHVLHNLGKRPFALTCSSVDNLARRWWLAQDKLGFLQLGDPPWESALGPDLAFVQIPVNLVSDIAKVATVVNLDHHQDLTSKEEPSSAIHKADLVFGAIGQWTTAEPDIVHLKALINVGTISKTTNRGGFDYLTHTPVPDGKAPMPSTFGGMSGGGVWRLYFQQTGERTLKFAQRRFLGVAFAESNPAGTDLPVIHCHGPTSLYEKLIPSIVNEPMRPGPR